MTTEKAAELQDHITREAIAQLALFGRNADTKHYEQSVKLIGTAWSLPVAMTKQRLELIAQERHAIQIADTVYEAMHGLSESELPINATGNETLNNVWDLFETAVRLDNRTDRQILYNTAWNIAETQNLMDWVILSEKEKQALSA